jgi:rare lipoprotein A
VFTPGIGTKVWRLASMITVLGVVGCRTHGEPAESLALPRSTLDSLVLEYPRLGSDPLPPPEPSPEADPNRIPARLVSVLPEDALKTITGEATYFANTFEGQRTASGIPFRQNQMVAAHRSYPFGTVLRVTNLRNDRAVNVRVVDRGPFGAKAAARNTIIDLSLRAAEELAYTDAGRVPVRVEVLEWGTGISG